ARQGTSKAVPVVVSAGLAVGVFVGLLFGVGTGKAEDGDEPVASAGSGSGSGSDQGTAAAGDPANLDRLRSGGAPDARVVDAGIDAVPAVDAATLDAAPTVVTATLTFDVVPADAVVTIDGVAVSGGTSAVELAAGKKVIKLVAKADGYRSYEKTLTVAGDETIAIKLPRRSGGSSGGGKSGGGKTGGGKTGGGKTGGGGRDDGGGLIDL
nr:PEGA domain-containing protein [Kofleriaceae bacterium]